MIQDGRFGHFSALNVNNSLAPGGKHSARQDRFKNGDKIQLCL
jgi:hypothetical protein